MGICHHCGTSITFIKGGGKRCDKCGDDPYKCHSCGTEINCEDNNECPMCGYYFCDDCGRCGPDCDHWEIVDDLQGELCDQCTRNHINKVVKHVADYMKGNIRRHCPRGVGISYAKGRIKNLIWHTMGYGRRDKDMSSFNERLATLVRIEKGKEWGIDEVRNEGEYGQEMRDASNLMICQGDCSRKFSPEEIYIRDEKLLCEHFYRGKIAKKVCPDCETEYSVDIESCQSCIYQRGPRKGLPKKLRLVRLNVDMCQLHRNKFIKEKWGVKNGGELLR